MFEEDLESMKWNELERQKLEEEKIILSSKQSMQTYILSYTRTERENLTYLQYPIAGILNQK